MNDQNSSNQSNNSLENILKELEERFGTNSDHEEKSSKKNRGANFKHFTASQIIGGLTLVLLAVGAAAGVYLGQTNQENRQQASVAYPQCSNTTGACDGVTAGGRCIGLAGTCQNTETSATCTCIPDPPTGTPIPTVFPCGFCAGGGGGSTVCSGEWLGVTDPENPCSAVPYCKCGTGPTTPPNTSTPTRTPTTVPPTGVPPTGVPPTGVPPTSVPPTSVPVSVTPGPTCNNITISYGTTGEPNRPVRIGDVITLTCGAIAGANRYEFRIGVNGNFLQNIAANAAGSRVSQPYTIAQSGTYGAQCRMCTASTSTSCQPWETLP